MANAFDEKDPVETFFEPVADQVRVRDVVREAGLLLKSKFEEESDKFAEARKTPEGIFNIVMSVSPIGMTKAVTSVRGIRAPVMTAVQKLLAAIKGGRKIQPSFGQAQSVERGKRAAQVAATQAQAGGEAGFRQQLGQLKGTLTERPVFEPPKLNKVDIDELFNQVNINKLLLPLEKVSAGTGLADVLAGKLPQKSQIALMEEVFGTDLIRELVKKRPLGQKLRDIVTEINNIPRILMTIVDMSAVLRQGVLLTTTKPGPTVRALGESFRQVFSQKNFVQWFSDLTFNPRYAQMRGSGLFISDPTKIGQGLSGKEEAFMTNFMQKIPVIGPVIQASERAFVSFLNKLRVDTFTQLANKFEKEGVASARELRALADFINVATGRGKLGKLEVVAQELNTLFFSARLQSARFTMFNPMWYVNQPPAVRRESIKTFAEFVAVGTTVLTLINFAGGKDVKVGVNPISTDFGKVRVGNTTWDIWGGFQQWVRVFSQFVSGYRITQKGDLKKLDKNTFPFAGRFDVVGQFVIGKIAPGPSLIKELIDGQDLFGQKLTLSNEIAENTTPLYFQDLMEAIHEFGPSGIFSVGLPAFFGVGVQSFDPNDRKSGSGGGNPFNPGSGGGGGNPFNP